MVTHKKDTDETSIPRVGRYDDLITVDLQNLLDAQSHRSNHI